MTAPQVASLTAVFPLPTFAYFSKHNPGAEAVIGAMLPEFEALQVEANAAVTRARRVPVACPPRNNHVPAT